MTLDTYLTIKPELHIQIRPDKIVVAFALTLQPLQLRNSLTGEAIFLGTGLGLLKKHLPHYFCHLIFQFGWRTNVQISWVPGGIIQINLGQWLITSLSGMCSEGGPTILIVLGRDSCIGSCQLPFWFIFLIWKRHTESLCFCQLLILSNIIYSTKSSQQTSEVGYF